MEKVTNILNKTLLKTIMADNKHNSAFEKPIEALEDGDPGIADRSKRHHPGTAFEEYCSTHPDASECRVYED